MEIQCLGSRDPWLMEYNAIDKLAEREIQASELIVVTLLQFPSVGWKSSTNTIRSRLKISRHAPGMRYGIPKNGRIRELVYVGASGKSMGPDVIAFGCRWLTCSARK